MVGCSTFHLHLRGGWERALASVVLKRRRKCGVVRSSIVEMSVGFQIATSSRVSNQSRHAEERNMDEQAFAQGEQVRIYRYL